MPPILYLLDGHALAYRSFFALTRGDTSAFTTTQGEPTAGVFGFTSILLRLMEQDHPEYLAVTFDTGKTFRDDIYPEYKATREKMPDELRTQIDRIRQLVDAFNIPRLEVEGYEADDVLGSIATRVAAQGFGVKIITGDRDLLQLVTERILVNLPGKTLADAKDYFPKDVEEYLGVRPDQVVDYKALVGDKSDNIPGVMGVGEKTSTTLLKTYNTLDNIYAHLGEISEATRKKLEAGRDSAYLSQKLATIVTDLDITLDMEMAQTSHFDPVKVEVIFRQLEFRSLMGRLKVLYPITGKDAAAKSQQMALFSTGESAPASRTTAPPPDQGIAWEVVTTSSALRSLVNQLRSAEQISVDTETTSTDQMRADLVGISLAIKPNKGYYIPVGHQPEMGDQLPLQEVITALKGPLTDPLLPKIGHNLKYDFVVLARHGLRMFPMTFDSMVAEWLINPTSHNLGLKNLAWVRLDLKMTSIEELIGSGKKQRTMASVPIQEAGSYAAADAVAVLRLQPVLQVDLKRRSADKLFQELEMPLVTVLADMEMAGILLDLAFLKHMSTELNGRLGDIEHQIHTLVGESFNINSTQQLSQVLFNRLKLPPPDRTRRTDSGHFSTSADVLEGLRGHHPMVDLVLEFRELSKLKSTYVDALPLQVNPQTGRVHTSYNQAGAVTGRIASSEPNLQNIPIRSELGRQVRQAFISDPDWVLLSVDYSQVELRIVAHLANDQAMLSAFQAGQDIHAATAAGVFNFPLQQVTKDMRRHAKAINFGLIYGMSAFGLTRTSDLTLAEAENFVAAYFRQFPGVKFYLDNVRRQAASQGFVETILGRRRYFPNLKSQTNANIRAREEREAINAPIQGSAADIMKIAMLRVPPALHKAGLAGRILLQVHDELVLECPTDQLKATANLVCQVMEDAYELKAPLQTEARYGRNWGEMTVL